MAISYDLAKREETLAERGLDFADAEEVFASLLTENPDDRFDYGEETVHHGRLPRRKDGRPGLDAARRGSARHFDAKGQCT